MVSDSVINPDYYKKGGIECYDAIQAATEGLPGPEAFCVGCAIKYIWRFANKENPEADITKAIWYLNKLRERISEQSKAYQIVITPSGTGISTPWGTTMVPLSGDMFTTNDKARERLLEAMLKSGGHCPCQVEKTDDTLCPCKFYREQHKCMCGMFVKVPQQVKGEHSVEKESE